MLSADGQWLLVAPHPSAPPSRKIATWALAAGIIGAFFADFSAAQLTANGLGIIAINRITKGTQAGKAMAVAAIVLGTLCLVVGALGFVNGGSIPA